ncbi:unnamed protein product [Macrosiphum euphorbiae]|uniref:Uncharacterized protein n=1 Tax=Macrosiphum euphorbiae TaxID=13131 RepID=A0AAV0WS32_9HEMI|nr:unnamed protein product [Macrosiphum euphorbiae]
MEAAIERIGTGEDFLLAIRDIYAGATSSVSVAGGLTNDIPMRSGIKQGCPPSGLLLILAINPVVGRVRRPLGACVDGRLVPHSRQPGRAQLTWPTVAWTCLGSSSMRPSARRCTCLVDCRWVSGTRSFCCEVPPSSAFRGRSGNLPRRPGWVQRRYAIVHPR